MKLCPCQLDFKRQDLHIFEIDISRWTWPVTYVGNGCTSLHIPAFPYISLPQSELCAVYTLRPKIALLEPVGVSIFQVCLSKIVGKKS